MKRGRNHSNIETFVSDFSNFERESVSQVTDAQRQSEGIKTHQTFYEAERWWSIFEWAVSERGRNGRAAESATFLTETAVHFD
jgi:hypothetical protein